jgi:hypothetical protein
MRLTEASLSRFFRNSRIWKSACRYAGKVRESANHFEVQSRVIPRRMPIGFTL